MLYPRSSVVSLYFCFSFFIRGALFERANGADRDTGPAPYADGVVHGHRVPSHDDGVRRTDPDAHPAGLAPRRFADDHFKYLRERASTM